MYFLLPKEKEKFKDKSNKKKEPNNTNDSEDYNVNSCNDVEINLFDLKVSCNNCQTGNGYQLMTFSTLHKKNE